MHSSGAGARKNGAPGPLSNIINLARNGALARAHLLKSWSWQSKYAHRVQGAPMMLYGVITCENNLNIFGRNT